MTVLRYQGTLLEAPIRMDKHIPYRRTLVHPSIFLLGLGPGIYCITQQQLPHYFLNMFLQFWLCCRSLYYVVTLLCRLELRLFFLFRSCLFLICLLANNIDMVKFLQSSVIMDYSTLGFFEYHTIELLAGLAFWYIYLYSVASWVLYSYI